MSEKLTIANPEDGNRPLSYQALSHGTMNCVWVTWASRTRCGAARTASSWPWPVESSMRRPDDERRGLRTARERLQEARARRTVSWLHGPVDSLGRGVRLLHRLGDVSRRLRASHRQWHHLPYGIRFRAIAAPVPRFERGGSRIKACRGSYSFLPRQSTRTVANTIRVAPHPQRVRRTGPAGAPPLEIAGSCTRGKQREAVRFGTVHALRGKKKPTRQRGRSKTATGERIPP